MKKHSLRLVFVCVSVAHWYCCFFRACQQPLSHTFICHWSSCGAQVLRWLKQTSLTFQSRVNHVTIGNINTITNNDVIIRDRASLSIVKCFVRAAFCGMIYCIVAYDWIFLFWWILCDNYLIVLDLPISNSHIYYNQSERSAVTECLTTLATLARLLARNLFPLTLIIAKNSHNFADVC